MNVIFSFGSTQTISHSKRAAFVLNVSVDTIYKLIQTKALAAKRISSRKTIISSEELQRYINSK